MLYSIARTCVSAKVALGLLNSDQRLFVRSRRLASGVANYPSLRHRPYVRECAVHTEKNATPRKKYCFSFRQRNEKRIIFLTNCLQAALGRLTQKVFAYGSQRVI